MLRLGMNIWMLRSSVPLLHLAQLARLEPLGKRYQAQPGKENCCFPVLRIAISSNLLCRVCWSGLRRLGCGREFVGFFRRGLFR